MKLGIVYWTSGGNTEDLANRLKETAQGKGIEVIMSDVDSADKDSILGCDVVAFGSPAQGTEEISPEMEDLMDSINDEIKDKKVLLFGSYGWGGGEYMEAWQDTIESKGAKLATAPVVCLEAPDDEAFAKIDDALASL